ncbi:MAG: imidazoleglycerol-phosphate dehydratase [Thermoplasmatota archaeon]
MVDLVRETRETRIRLSLARGTGASKVSMEGAFAAGEPGHAGGAVAFAKHMVETLAKWSGFDVTVEARSLDGLEHHLVEDVAITLGRALRKEIDVGKIQRVGHAYVPMDEALVLAAVDLVERPFYAGEVPDPMMDHFLRSFATEAGMTLHIRVLAGKNVHHIVEAAVKATAVALRNACEPRGDRLSTKGAVGLADGTTKTTKTAKNAPPTRRQRDS